MTAKENSDLKRMMISRRFVVRPDFDVARIAHEFSRYFQGKGELLSQPTSAAPWSPKKTEEDFPWATGWFLIEPVKWTVFLNNHFIEFGTTPAEQRYVRERDGRTDRFMLRFSSPELQPAASSSPRNEELSRAVAAQINAAIDEFLIHLHAKAFVDSCAWEDYPDAPKLVTP